MYTSFVQNHCNNIEAARAAQSRKCAIASVKIDKNSPFNIKIKDPIKDNYQVAINSKIQRPLVKNANLNPGDTNVALYDIRGRALSDTEQTLLQNHLMHRHDERVQLQIDAVKYAQHGVNVPSNGCFNLAQVNEKEINFCGRSDDYVPKRMRKTIADVYNPMLPTSETNERPYDLPAIMDERIERKRNERPYLYESEQMALNLNVAKSDEVKRKRQMQTDMLEVNRNGNGVSRLKYDRRMHPEVAYSTEDESEIKEVNRLKGSELNPYNKTDIIPKRNAYDESDSKHLHEINSANVKDEVKNDMNGTRLQEISAASELKIHRDKSENKQQKNEGVMQTIVEKFKNLIGLERQDPVKIVKRGSFETHKNDLELEMTTERFQTIARNTNHVKLCNVRGVDKPIVMNGDDEYSNMAAGIITLDKTVADDFKIVKTVAYVQDGQFIIMQKLENDRVFMGDMNEVNDDLLVLTVPEEDLDKDFRHRIDQLNPYKNKRAQVLNLTYNDYVQVTNFAENNQTRQERLSVNTAFDNVRGFNYERDILNGGHDEDGSTFIDVTLKDKLVDTIRKRVNPKITTRVMPNYAVDTTAENVTGTSKLQLKNRSGAGLSPNYTTNRSKMPPRNPCK